MYSNLSAQSNNRPASGHDSRRSTFSESERGRSSSVKDHAHQWTEHHYALSDARDPSWATLMVRSRAPSPSHLPSAFEGEDITGEVTLNLPREDSIKAVVISVELTRCLDSIRTVIDHVYEQIIGQITTSVTEVYPFLTLTQDLWSIEMGDPTPHLDVPFSGKLLGRYQWPFTFTIPPSVELTGASGARETFRVPPSFSERLTWAHIQYQLIARIRRGKFRVDTQLSTVFAFTPFTYPGPFSEARQMAYRRNYAPPGPEQDPEGWTSAGPVRVRGTIFGSRVVDAECRLSLANPLCYTRGSVIPCCLSIDCADTQALDLLSIPQAVDVRLLRHISKAPSDITSLSVGPSTYGVELEETSKEIKSAVWWLSADSPHRRILSGEIHLPKDLKPNCRIGKFDLYYTVNLFSLKVVAFTYHHASPNSLLVQPVEIATAFASGPRPRIYLPSPPPGGDDAGSSARPPSEFSFRV